MRTGTQVIIAQREDGAPNLDGQWPDELEDFARDIRDNSQAIADELFPHKPDGYLDATLALGIYAAIKAKAMQCRGAGSIKAALKLESLCDKRYQRLPEFARW